jgi:signal transduction histidine kinase
VGRLYRRIYLHLLAVLVVVAIATTVVFAVSGRGGLAREVAGRLARHAAALVGERLHDPAGPGPVVERLHADLDLDLAVRDLDGRLLAGAGAAPPALTSRERAEVAGGRTIVRPFPRWTAAVPVRDPATGRIAAVLVASAGWRLGTSHLLAPLLVLGSILVIVAVAAAPLARRISRPLERLTEAAHRLGGGDLSARVPLPARAARRPDELDGLARAFNEMAARVERLVRDQKALLANVSHELRSPLARLRMALALLPAGGEDEGRRQDIEREIDDLDRLVDDVLTASRLDLTGLPQHLGPVDAAGLLAEVAERARRDPRMAGMAIQVAAAGPVPFVGDEVLLRRAVWNLVENAAKYGAPPITLEAQATPGHVVLRVTDAGPGIPEAERDRVFSPFYRIDRARTPGPTGGGFGLGLTLVRRVVEVHGGTIAIETASEAGRATAGCRVTMTLPLHP